MVPHSLVGTGNNTTDLQIVDLSTNLATFEWDELVGGTILRTIMDIVYSPTYPTAPAVNYTWENYVHVGIFVTEDTAPSAAIWDPNAPHGSFMYREMMSKQWVSRQTSAGDSQSSFADSHGGRMHIDSKIRRRIEENEKMWVVARFFTTIPSNDAIGYTGRLLVQLP